MLLHCQCKLSRGEGNGAREKRGGGKINTIKWRTRAASKVMDCESEGRTVGPPASCIQTPPPPPPLGSVPAPSSRGSFVEIYLTLQPQRNGHAALASL